MADKYVAAKAPPAFGCDLFAEINNATPDDYAKEPERTPLFDTHWPHTMIDRKASL